MLCKCVCVYAFYSLCCGGSHCHIWGQRSDPHQGPFIYLFVYSHFILWVTLGFQCILEKNLSMHYTCKSCNSVRSLALSADRHWLSVLDADSLLSKQETKFDRCFSYLKHIDRNTGVSKSKNWINYSVYTVCCTDCICPGQTSGPISLLTLLLYSKLNAFFLNSSYFCQR